jgi:hypothetical protein
MRQTFRSSTDNGEEFRGSEFEAYLTKYKIKHLYTSPGHPQTNGKVERLNHELVQRLQRISAEDHHQLENWDEYLSQALLAFHAHKNQRMGCSPFYLQYGVEPVLPHASIVSSSTTALEREIAKEDRRMRVQNLDKYRTEAAQRLETLAKNRDNTAFLNDPIMPGDLVMREPLNRKSKLHPRWDGRFVIGSSEKDVFQLATANGYKLPHLHNIARLRKLNKEERARYTEDFWDASNRLKLHDRIAREQSELNDVNIRLAEATRQHLQDQRSGVRTDLQEITKIREEQRQKEQDLCAARGERAALQEGSSAPRTSARVRRAPVRFEDM